MNDKAFEDNVPSIPTDTVTLKKTVAAPLMHGDGTSGTLEEALFEGEPIYAEHISILRGYADTLKDNGVKNPRLEGLAAELERGLIEEGKIERANGETRIYLDNPDRVEFTPEDIREIRAARGILLKDTITAAEKTIDDAIPQLETLMKNEGKAGVVNASLTDGNAVTGDNINDAKQEAEIMEKVIASSKVVRNYLYAEKNVLSAESNALSRQNNKGRDEDAPELPPTMPERMVRAYAGKVIDKAELSAFNVIFMRDRLNEKQGEFEQDYMKDPHAEISHRPLSNPRDVGDIADQQEYIQESKRIQARAAHDLQDLQQDRTIDYTPLIKYNAEDAVKSVKEQFQEFFKKPLDADMNLVDGGLFAGLPGKISPSRDRG